MSGKTPKKVPVRSWQWPAMVLIAVAVALTVAFATGYRCGHEAREKTEAPAQDRQAAAPGPPTGETGKESPSPSGEPANARKEEDPIQAEIRNLLAQKPAHPHLLFSKEDVPALRERVKGGVPQEAWERLRKAVDANLKDEEGSPAKTPTVLGKFLGELGARAAFVRRKAEGAPPLKNGCDGEALSMLYQTAFVWLVSGEERYAERFRKNAQALQAAFPDGIAAANGLNELALAYDLGYDLLTAEQRKAFQAGLLQFKPDELKKGLAWDRDVYGAGTYGNLAHPGHFWFTLPLLALLGEPGFRPDVAAEAVRDQRRFLEVFFGEDGDFPEHLSYLHYGVQCDGGPLALCALQRKGVQVIGKGSAYARFLSWVPYELVPGTNMGLGMGDASFAPTTDPDLYKLLLWADPDNPYANWLAGRIGGGVGLPVGTILWHKEPKAVEIAALAAPVKHARYMGTVYFRDGWRFGDPALTFDVHLGAGTNHEQGDVGHFTLHAFGEWFAADSGYAGWDETHLGNRSGRAHNLVLMDGRGQDAQMWRCNFQKCGRPMGGDIQYVLDNPFAAATTADLREAYSLDLHGYTDWLQDQRLATDPVGTARRSIAWVRPDSSAHVPGYFVVCDDIEKDDREHDYDWLLQLAPDNVAELGTNAFTVAKNPALPESFMEGPGEPNRDGKFGSARITVETPKDGRYWLFVLAGCSDRTGAGFRYYSAAINGRPAGYSSVGASESVWDWHGLNNQTPDGLELKAGKHEIAIEQGSHGARGAAVRVAAVALSSVRDAAPSFLGVRPYARRENKPEDATPLPSPFAPPPPPDGVTLLPATAQNTAVGEGWSWKTEKRAKMDVLFVGPESLRLEQDVLRVRTGHGFWVVHPRVHAHAIWKSEARPAQLKGRNPHFTALLYPYRSDMERPSIEALSGNPPVVLSGDKMPLPAAKVTWSNAVDYIGGYQVRSERPLATQDLSIVRLPRDERLAKVRYLLVGGNRLAFRGKDSRKEDPPTELLKVEDPRNLTYVTAANSGAVLHVCAYPRPSAFWQLHLPVELRAYGPEVREAYVNGVKTPFRKEGDQVLLRITPERHETVKERIERRREEFYRRLAEEHRP